MAFAIIDVQGPESFSGKSNTLGVEYDAAWLVLFTGQFDPVALQYNTDNRLPKRGGYLLANTGGPPVIAYGFQTGDANCYVDSIGCDLAPESLPFGAADQPGIAHYSAHFAQITSERLDLSPLSRPALVEGEGGEDKYVSIRDKDGNALANSAGDLYDGLPEQFIQAVQLTIHRNESSNPASNAKVFSNSVNSLAWNGVAAGFGRIGKIKYEQRRESFNGVTVNYYRVSYPIVYRVDGWRWKPLDNGYRVKNGTKVVKYVDPTGCEPSTPILLDGTGNKAADGSTGVYFPAAGYKILQEQDWTTLSLPNPFA